MQIRCLTPALAGAALGALALGAGAEVPRTDGGKPDFSGTYDITTLTPWQRNPELGERMHFTPEEVDEIKRHVVQPRGAGRRAPRPGSRRPRGP